MNYRYGLRAALMASSAITAAYASPAWAQQAHSFDLPAQSASSGIAAFAEQADIQILVMESDTRGRQTRAVQGNMSASAGLEMLLEGSGLKVIADDGRTVTLAANDPQSGSAAGDGADGTVEALIVTAQKREEDIQDVPIAISAFTQEDLTRSQVAGGPDLMTQVPNMTFTKTNFSSYSVQIRGIGTQAISATTDAAVAVAFNNSTLIRNRFFEQEFYDLQRIEVLRGPQGTLYGRNATAGVVNIISAKPTFNFEAKASGDLANYSSTRLEAMINLPLVDDRVALRLAGAWTKRDGYVTNEITGNPIDGRDLWSTRLSLRFSPTDSIDANLIWEHFEEDDDRLRSGKQLCKKDVVTEVGGVPIPYDNNFGLSSAQPNLSQGCEATSLYSPEAFQTPNGYSLPFYHPLGSIWLPVVEGLDPYLSTVQSKDLRVIESTVDPHYRAETDVVEFQLTADLNEGLTVTSETAYISDDLFSTQDFNRFNTAPGAFSEIAPDRYGYRDGVLNDGFFCDPQIGCANRLVAVDLSTANSRQFSQEFRLSSNFDAPFNFSVGANFLRYDTEDKYYVFINTLSLYSALSPFGWTIDGTTYDKPTYVAGVSDNIECLDKGLVSPDPNDIASVTGCIYIDPNPIGNLNDMGHNYFLSRNPFKLISYAAFGEVYYDLASNLKLTAGLRWTVDRKEAPRIPSWVLATGTAGYPIAEVQHQEWREPTGRLTLDWKPNLAFTDETLFYASFAHGYKAGGSNPPPAAVVLYGAGAAGDYPEGALRESATHPKTFDAEYVNALELGAKNTLLDGRMTFNAAAFYYDYEGYQISQIVDRSAINYNFDARIWGLEVEADWRPLDNLRLGLKAGYENTRIADGEQAIDVMDRTAGREGWTLLKPVPTRMSNCIVPTGVVVTPTGEISIPGNIGGGGIGGCEIAYVLGLDPVTGAAYEANPIVGDTTGNPNPIWVGYEGFNPATAPNNGEGFFKQLGGNELPNAPNFTGTLTADYTLPLPNDWLMTLHSDLYYQSEAWTRVFNTEGYDKLKAYTNVNLAAIFTNEERGWNVMAYVKNVFDRDSITGAFLNSDDTGLTTNVFLTEPRLYGLRVTKAWTGGSWSGGSRSRAPGEPYPFILELGGAVQRHDAAYETIRPGFIDAFSPTLSPLTTQNRDLDWGDDRQVRLSYQPEGSHWKVSAGLRYGRTNGDTARLSRYEVGDTECAFAAPFDSFCDPDSAKYNPDSIYPAHNRLEQSARPYEEHQFIDFAVAYGPKTPVLGVTSSIGVGVRHARFESITDISLRGVPDVELSLATGFFQIPITYHQYETNLRARREFDGAGPTLSWDAAVALLGNEDAGQVTLDWSLVGGVLLGRREASLIGREQAGLHEGQLAIAPATELVTTEVREARSSSADVPLIDISVGLSYEVGRVRVGGGYRWERYFDAIDGGHADERTYDRTIDGPYFKLAIGFGG